MSPVQASLILALPLLLLASAFFSGSETALFSLAEHERMAMRRRGGIGAYAAAALLRRPRMLLITVLLGNMTVNVLYFVISSVLTLRAAGPAAQAAFSLGPLVALILFGEVAPKMLASARREVWCAVASPPLLALHRVIAPLRRVIDAAIIAPLARLFQSSTAPEEMTTEELDTLLTLSAHQGVLQIDEARLLEDVVELGDLHVRDVMTPRVDVRWLPADAGWDDVRALVEETGLRTIPICERSLDEGVLGMLPVKQFFAKATPGAGSTVRGFIEPALFVPEQATLDRLLEVLRTRRRLIAVVVDEYGGVAGVASIGDIVERLLEGLHAAEPEGAEERAAPHIEAAGPGRWRVPGRLSVHDWADAFGAPVAGRVATVAGLVLARLGRPAKPGDAVTVGRLRLEVEQVRGAAIETILVSVSPGASARGAAS